MLKVYGYPEWWPESWAGQTVILIAAGPSANKQNYEPYRGKAKFLTVNNSWKLAPWADAMFASDADWWNRNEDVPRKFPGLKMTMDFSITQTHRDVHLIRISKIHPNITVDRPGYVGVGLNSGFYALNLAVQFGPPKKIILCGYDMNMLHGTHWDGRHPVNNPDSHKLGRWCKILDNQSKILSREYKIEVINTCLTSSLNNYPKMTIEEAFGKGDLHG